MAGPRAEGRAGVTTPRFTTWLFVRSLDPRERGYVVGDCEEEYNAIAESHGPEFERLIRL